MILKKTLIGCIAVAIFTCVGFYFLAYGATEFEFTRQMNIFLIIGKILLWPWYLWVTIRSFIFPEQKINSFLSIEVSQVFGYFLLFYVFDKIYKRWKKFKLNRS